MDNQHKQITGYRDLSQAEIDAMNQCKDFAKQCGQLIELMEQTPEIDKRWLAIAKTDLQKGFMSLVRSVAQPTTF